MKSTNSAINATTPTASEPLPPCLEVVEGISGAFYIGISGPESQEPSAWIAEMLEHEIPGTDGCTDIESAKRYAHALVEAWNRRSSPPVASEFSGHTPGPWRVNPDPTFNNVILGPDYIVARADKKFTGEAEEAANARLIAAAPTLLAERNAAVAKVSELKFDIDERDNQIGDLLAKVTALEAALSRLVRQHDGEQMDATEAQEFWPKARALLTNQEGAR